MKHRNEKMNEGGQLGIGLQGYTFFVVVVCFLNFCFGI